METKARIRVYSLMDKGLSFSYVTDSKMIVVGGRYDEKNRVGLTYEKELMGFQYIDTLVIPDWNSYFCKPSELRNMLSNLLPDYVLYTDVEPGNEMEMRSRDMVLNYSDGAIIEANSNDFLSNHRGIAVSDSANPFMLYLSSGNLSVAFYNQCRSEADTSKIIHFFEGRLVDVLIGGQDFMDEEYAQKIIDVLNPNTVVGRLNPSAKNDRQNRVLHVAKEDLYISKVDNEVVRLKIGKGFPEFV